MTKVNISLETVNDLISQASLKGNEMLVNQVILQTEVSWLMLLTREQG